VCDKNRDLTIHHRDKTGMKSTGTYKKSNNNIDNLVTVCRKCHSNHHFKKTNPLLLPVC
jgi:5-methylcytosine-specific restriction endonuclease McrA